MTAKLKICLIGASGVGKTSLVSRFVHSIFSERYRTTIGVMIEQRDVRLGDATVRVIIWDLSGEDEFQNVQPAYLRGAAGYILVVDGTRRDTVETALHLEARVRATLGDIPHVIAANKADLLAAWELDAHALAKLEREGGRVARTSAKTGDGVEALFSSLAETILTQGRQPWS